MIWESPENRLAKARKRGDVAWCEEVCRLADKADALMSEGKTDKATQLYCVIAELDVDDKLISEVVNHSRTVLETQSIASSPTIDAEYQQYLDTLPPHDRHVMLARQLLRRLSSALPEDDRPALIARAIDHFEEANRIMPLGKKDQRVLAGLKIQRA
jgi:hypothetical protein